jgi:hypothetical protein
VTSKAKLTRTEAKIADYIERGAYFQKRWGGHAWDVDIHSEGVKDYVRDSTVQSLLVKRPELRSQMKIRGFARH